jgi:hypothetical protein
MLWIWVPASMGIIGGYRLLTLDVLVQVIMKIVLETRRGTLRDSLFAIGKDCGLDRIKNFLDVKKLAQCVMGELEARGYKPFAICESELLPGSFKIPRVSHHDYDRKGHPMYGTVERKGYRLLATDIVYLPATKFTRQHLGAFSDMWMDHFQGRDYLYDLFTGSHYADINDFADKMFKLIYLTVVSANSAVRRIMSFAPAEIEKKVFDFLGLPTLRAPVPNESYYFKSFADDEGLSLATRASDGTMWQCQILFKGNPNFRTLAESVESVVHFFTSWKSRLEEHVRLVKRGLKPLPIRRSVDGFSVEIKMTFRFLEESQVSKETW